MVYEPALVSGLAARLGRSCCRQGRQADEGIIAHPMPVADVWRLVDAGEIKDAKTLAAFVAPPPPAANGQPARAGTTPTPQAQGKHGLTDEERRARATRTF